MKIEFRLMNGATIKHRELDVLPHKGMTIVFTPYEWFRVVDEPLLDLELATIPKVTVIIRKVSAPSGSPMDRWFPPEGPRH